VGLAFMSGAGVVSPYSREPDRRGLYWWHGGSTGRYEEGWQVSFLDSSFIGLCNPWEGWQQSEGTTGKELLVV